MTGLRRTAWLVLALPAALALALLGLLGAATPASASARTMVIEDGTHGPVLVPASLTVSPGDTVSFLNASNYPLGYDVTVTYAGHVEFAETVAFGASSAGHWTAPGTAGRRTVTATQRVSGVSATGSITVVAPSPAPSGSPSPSPSTSPTRTASPAASPRPSAHATSSASPRPTRSAHPSPTASAAPTRSAHASPTPSVAPLPGGGPGGGGGVAGSPPPAAGRPAAGGTLEQPTGRGRGLPAALAAVLVGGSAAAYVRVLLAEPVDGAGGTVPGRG